MKKKVILMQTVEAIIDIPDIEQALQDYRGCISSDADYDDLFTQIAYTNNYGSSFTEGIGEENKEYIIESWDEDFEYEFEEMEEK